MKLKNLVPMLNVSNIENSLAFYEKTLDFALVSPLEAVKEWRWALIRSGDTDLMLAETDHDLGLVKEVFKDEHSPWPAVFYFYPEDVQVLYEHVRGVGVETTLLETTFYGMREFSLKDPDGHLLSFGQDADEIANNA